MSSRAIFYSDGFNLYHAIESLRQPHLKWFSLKALAELAIRQKTERVERVVFFSATPSHLAARFPDKIKRHNTYVRALEATGVECVLGQFKTRKTRCRQCGHNWTDAEEKETDVHIGARLIRDAYQDNFDVIYLITNDTDLVPAIKMFKADFPDKEIVGLTAPGRRYAGELDAVIDRKQKITAKLLRRCLLPETLTHPDGRVVRRPTPYSPPVS